MKVLCIISTFAAFAASSSLIEQKDFAEFQSKFGKTYKSEDERKERLAIFNQNLDKIQRHNSIPNVSWTMGVNQFSDMTDEEFGQKVLAQGVMIRGRKSATTEGRKDKPLDGIKDSVDWREHPSNPITPVKNQGSCGSCWAHAAVEQIESYHILKYPDNGTIDLSVEELTACMPDPGHCGGKGGCEGAITPLAYTWVQSYGLTTEKEYPYTSGSVSGTSPCNLKEVTKKPRATWTRGYETLPANDQDAIMKHLSEKGPLDVGIDGYKMRHFSRGIFSDCNYDNVVINHAVQLVGYGSDESHGDYWLIRNSWGTSPNDDGYIKIQRDTEPKCVMDKKPQIGDGCEDDGIDEVKVCGCLGILYQAAYPIIV